MNKHKLLQTAGPPASGNGLRRGIAGADSHDRAGTLLARFVPPVRLRLTAGTVRCAKRVLITAFAAIFVTTSVWAQSSQSAPDVTAMSLEDLMNLQVTSVSKRSQKVADAAA